MITNDVSAGLVSTARFAPNPVAPSARSWQRDSMSTKFSHMTFCGGGHWDRIGRSYDPIIADASNPGRFIERPGGAALNVASVFASLGGTAFLASAISDDQAGGSVRACLRERGIEAGLQVIEGENTASYTALLQPDGSLLAALADMNVYGRFDPDKVNAPDAIFVDTNLTETAISSLLKRHRGFAAAASVSRAKARRLLPVLDQIDLLFTNKGEAAALCNLQEDTEAAVMADKLLKSGCRAVIISQGPGSVYRHDGSIGEQISVPSIDHVVDVTGAGDALAGGTLSELAKGVRLDEAIATGITVASAIVKIEGPWRPDLADQLKLSKCEEPSS